MSVTNGNTLDKTMRWAVVGWSVTNETHSSVLIQLFNAKFSSNYVVFIFIKETKVNFILTSYMYIYMKYFVKFSKKLCNLLFLVVINHVFIVKCD